MKFVTVEQIKKLRESGPRKKDREFWDIGRKDINSGNYNIWLCWLETVIRYIEVRSKRSTDPRDKSAPDEHPHSETHS